MGMSMIKYYLPISHLAVCCHPGSHPLIQRPSTGSQAEVPRQCPQDLEQLYPKEPGVHSTRNVHSMHTYILPLRKH